MNKKGKCKPISATVFTACEKSGIDPAIELLKIAKKANVSLNLKVKIYQHFMKFLYPNMNEQVLLDSQLQAAQLESMKLLEGLTMEDLRRLANP